MVEESSKRTYAETKRALQRLKAQQLSVKKERELPRDVLDDCSTLADLLHAAEEQQNSMYRVEVIGVV